MIDITGLKFWKLTVIKKSEIRNSSNDILWDCACDCGGKKATTSGALRHGGTKSCGCIRGNPKHGDYNKRIHIVWVNMIRRCYNALDNQYSNYGGRGIKVCNNWKNYSNFKHWAYKNGYADTLTIDRINVNKGYNPENCRWATYKQQANNRRNNTILIIDGISKTISEWSVFSGINQLRISARIKRGWEYKKAVFEAINKEKTAKKYLKNVY